jgi:hypothetical protein
MVYGRAEATQSNVEVVISTVIYGGISAGYCAVVYLLWRNDRTP